MKIKNAPALHCLSAGTITVLTAIILILPFPEPGFGNSPSYAVARVNGVTIYQSELSCAVEAVEAQELLAPSTKSKRSDPGGKNAVLERLVKIELLYQESLKYRFHGLIAESDELYQTEVKRAGGENKLAAALQCIDKSPEQFRKSLFRKLSIKHFLNEKVYSRINVTQEDAREFYNRNIGKFRESGTIRLKQILIKAPPDPASQKWQKARQRAFEIYNDAVRGVDFVRLVHKHSEDPVSATARGDLDPIQKDSSHGVIDTVIFTMKPGSVTKPIVSRQGFHILKIIEITQPSTKKFEDVEKDITTLLRRKQAGEMTYQILKDLKSQARIEILETGAGKQ